MHDINFFSSYIKVRSDAGKKTYKIAAVIGVLAAFVLILPLYYGARVLINNAIASSCTTYLNSGDGVRLAEKIRDLDQRKAVIDQYKGQLDALLTGADAASSLSGNILREVSMQMPTGLFINSVSLNGATLTMTGVGKDRVSIAKFEHNIKQDYMFMNVSIDSISGSGGQGAAGGYTFTLNSTLTKKE